MDTRLSLAYFKRLENDGWQRAEMQGENWLLYYNESPVVLTKRKNWVHVQAILPDNDSLRRLGLLLNSSFLMAKIGMTRSGDLMIAAEWPAANLSFAALKLVMTSVARAIDFLKNPDSAEPNADAGKPASGRVAMSIPKEHILRYLRQLDTRGWSLGAEPQNARWHFGYRSHNQISSVFMQFTTCWTHFQAPIQIDVTSSLSERNVVAEYLLHLNHRMMMAKFRMTKERAIVLTIQCPTEQMEFPLFQACMEGMATYLDRFVPETILLANSARLAEFVDSGRLPKPNDLGIEASV